LIGIKGYVEIDGERMTEVVLKFAVSESSGIADHQRFSFENPDIQKTNL